MDDLERRSRVLRRTAWLCLTAMAATVLLSAFMRLAQAGPSADAVAPAVIAAARLAHRVVASVVLIGSLLILPTALSTPALRRERAPAAALVALALALAALGLITPGARLPAVTIGNLLGGFAMLALCARLAAGAGRRPGAGGWATLVLALVLMQVALGAQVSAAQAARACADLADCLGAAASGDWGSLNPWREPLPQASTPAQRTAAPLLLLHRAGAIVVLGAIAGVAALAWRRGRRAGAAALLVLATAQATLGTLLGAAASPLPTALLHNAVAALLLITLVLLR